jgi:beta-glucosidase
MVNGIDGVMGGTTTFDSMLAFMITGKGGLAGYENDPVAVAAMREACHHNLYAIANSCGMNGEWNCNGLQITDNVLNSMVNGIEGVMGGTTTFDSMLAFMITGKNGLAGYENDPVAVAAMREACHHNLYAIANSQAMNGIGADTTIKAVKPSVIGTCKTAAIILGAIFVVSLVMWILKVRKFKQTEAYATYKEFKKSLKNK